METLGIIMLVAGVLLLGVGIFFRENKKPTRIGQ